MFFHFRALPFERVPIAFSDIAHCAMSSKTNLLGSTLGGTLAAPRFIGIRRGHPPLGVLFRHFHGGTGRGSAHKPFLASRAFLSNPSSTVSPGAYFRNHQHQP